MNQENHSKNGIWSRKSIRLQGYDYRRRGSYFITICTHEMEFLFGHIKKGMMNLNNYGEIINLEWFQIAIIRSNIELFKDEFVIMPNHIHGVLRITEGSVTRQKICVNNPGPAPGSLGAIIGQFKSITTKKINLMRNTSGKSVWQRNYFDRIIRNNKELTNIRNYIHNNPYRWEDDRGSKEIKNG